MPTAGLNSTHLVRRGKLDSRSDSPELPANLITIGLFNLDIETIKIYSIVQTSGLMLYLYIKFDLLL